MESKAGSEELAQQARLVSLPAVLYAAKSTEDLHGSIPTQLEDCRALAEREGWEVVKEFTDEGFSAYSGNRGPGLRRAEDVAVAAAGEHGRCVILAQHSDRISRGAGDAPDAADHLAELYFRWKRHGVVMWSCGEGELDGLRAFVSGERNTEDSRRKGQATAAGQRRRFESGKRLGGKIRDGFKLVQITENGVGLVGKDGRAERDVALDPDRRPVWDRIFDLIESGRDPGDVRATLNAEGVYRKSGKPWTTRDIRRGVLDDYYAGRAHAYGETIEDDHEPLIDPERWERIAAMVRTDERASKGGAAALAGGADYLLRGIATCGCCGSSLRTRKLGRRPHVHLRAVREGHGTCEAPYIPAEAAEGIVLDHLNDFVGGMDEWLAGRVQTAAGERDRFAETLERERGKLKQLDVRAQRADAAADRLLDEGDEETAAAMVRKAEAVRADIQDREHALAAGEAKLADWPSPDVDEALDVYRELSEAVRGRLSGSQSVQELRAHLRATVADAQLEYEEDGSLYATFFLRVAEQDRGRRRRWSCSRRPGARPDHAQAPTPSAKPSRT